MSERVDAAGVAARVRDLGAGPRFVGIDGFGAAGKSTLAAAVARAVPEAVVVPVDDLQGPGITEWDWAALCRDVVAPLLAGRDGEYVTRRWGEAAPTGRATVPAGAIVVIEGVSATRREAEVPWDLTVWVEAPEPVRRARALERDGPRGQRVWREEWIPSELAYAARERPWERVDLVVDGTALRAGTMDTP